MTSHKLNQSRFSEHTTHDNKRQDMAYVQHGFCFKHLEGGEKKL